MIDCGNDFVQKFILRKGSAAEIILYTNVISILYIFSHNNIKEQLLDLQSHVRICNKLIIGIDRTFNLGPLYLTAITYKDMRVISRKTNESPIKLGPMLLHREAKMENYADFLSHIKSNTSLYIFLHE